MECAKQELENEKLHMRSLGGICQLAMWKQLLEKGTKVTSDLKKSMIIPSAGALSYSIPEIFKIKKLPLSVTIKQDL